MNDDSNSHEESRFILRLKKETNMVRIEIIQLPLGESD
jgi:hypothetical protein